MKMKGVSADVQKAWNLMSMHNSELLLENAELKLQISHLESRIPLMDRACIGLVDMWYDLKHWWINRKTT